MRAFSIAFAALALMCTPACATAVEEEVDTSCLSPLPLTASLVRDAGAYDFSGYAGAGAVPAFLIGSLSPTRDAEEAQDLNGSVVFVREASGTWRALVPRNGENVVAIFASEAGEMFVVTMWQSEGPGQSWTMLRSPNGLQSATCAQVRFPGALNQPAWSNEFLSLHDLDIGDRRRGEMVGVAHTETRGDLWYVYRTSNDGASWGRPIRLRSGREATPGRFNRITEDVAPLALVAELQRYAEGR